MQICNCDNPTPRNTGAGDPVCATCGHYWVPKHGSKPVTQQTPADTAQRPAPRLEIVVTRVCCAKHLEPFRLRWPMGYPVFVNRALTAILLQADFVADVRNHPLFNDTPESEIAAVHALLDAKPICCRLRGGLLQVYFDVQGATGTWARSRCVLCKRTEYGAPFRKLKPMEHNGSKGHTWPHVCLRCVCNRPGTWHIAG